MVGELRLVRLGKFDHIKQGDRIIPAEVSPLRAFDLSGDLEPAKAACCEPGGWAQAFGMLEAIADKGRVSGQGKALYVIGVEGREDVAKIGVSANPFKRLAELQGGNYRKLYLHAVVFTPKRNAVKIEQAALDCKERMRGEWVELTPEQALDRVFDCAKRDSVPIIDGKHWFADMARRTRELARATKFRKAA